MKPTMLPEARQQMLNYYSSASGREIWMEITKQAGCLGKTDLNDSEVEMLFTEERGRWNSADLYYVTAPMCQVAFQAAESMPSFEWQHSDMPSRRGVIFFEVPLESSKDSTSERPGLPIVAVSWGASQALEARRGEMGIWVAAYTLTADALSQAEEEARREHERSNPPWSLDESLRRVRALYLDHPFHYDDEFAMWPGSIAQAMTPTGVIPIAESWVGRWTSRLICCWLLMQQSQTAASHEEMPDRAARRRMQRAGVEVINPVRVITLRRRRHEPSGDHPGREYHHQWVVKGHWKMQPHGPGSALRKPIYIVPYIAGPEDKPLLGGEKVYVWSR